MLDSARMMLRYVTWGCQSIVHVIYSYMLVYSTVLI
jgi:hypothetical protein